MGGTGVGGNGVGVGGMGVGVGCGVGVGVGGGVGVNPAIASREKVFKEAINATKQMNKSAVLILTSIYLRGWALYY